MSNKTEGINPTETSESVSSPGVAGLIAEVFLDDDARAKNRSKVGGIRPSAMLYTAGVGSTIDLPHIAVMPQGLDAWEKAFQRQGGAALVRVPRLLEAVRGELGSSVTELRQPPWVADEDGAPVGIPTRVFPQWLRCTGCNLLAPVSSNVFEFENVSKHRPDQAQFFHKNCTGRPAKGAKQGTNKARKRPTVPARYMVACTNGHLDEFPYKEWVHFSDGHPTECKVPNPQLRLVEYKSNLGPQVSVECRQCGSSRNMAEITRAGGAELLPNCRGRHPHLPTYASAENPCKGEVKLMLLGAANQWFPTTISVLVLPARKTFNISEIVLEVLALPPNMVAAFTSPQAIEQWKVFADPALVSRFDSATNDQIWDAVQIATGNVQAIIQSQTEHTHDPNRLLAPEWETLTHPKDFEAEDRKAGFKVHPVTVAQSLSGCISEVVAVDRIRKANAFTGFTRIDAPDRVGGERGRIAPLTQNGNPTWVPATEDRGEGVFIRFDEQTVNNWEEKVIKSEVWRAHAEAHVRNVSRRQSTTGVHLDAEELMPPPRYWALHTLSHLLIREMAMSSGYGSASLAERIYAWRKTDGREAAAGILITTTSPDSEGTLGGLVDLAKTSRLENLFHDAIHRAERCSSDPICADRLPKEQEDFLHGAACHFCVFLSETSCERANRFLDRRFVLGLNVGSHGLEPILSALNTQVG